MPLYMLENNVQVIWGEVWITEAYQDHRRPLGPPAVHIRLSDIYQEAGVSHVTIQQVQASKVLCNIM